jgi:hypothetical protein
MIVHRFTNKSNQPAHTAQAKVYKPNRKWLPQAKKRKEKKRKGQRSIPPTITNQS